MNDEYEGSERREFNRVNVNFLVTYNIYRPLEVRFLIGDRDLIGIMSNLSEGGMSIVTNYDIPALSVLSTKFTLINPHAVDYDRVRRMQVTGEVRYNVALEKKEHRLGVHFTQIEKKDQGAIANFVKMALITNVSQFA